MSTEIQNNASVPLNDPLDGPELRRLDAAIDAGRLDGGRLRKGAGQHRGLRRLRCFRHLLFNPW